MKYPSSNMKRRLSLLTTLNSFWRNILVLMTSHSYPSARSWLPLGSWMNSIPLRQSRILKLLCKFWCCYFSSCSNTESIPISLSIFIRTPYADYNIKSNMTAMCLVYSIIFLKIKKGAADIEIIPISTVPLSRCYHEQKPYLSKLDKN